MGRRKLLWPSNDEHESNISLATTLRDESVYGSKIHHLKLKNHGSSLEFENLFFANSFEPINTAGYSLIMGMNGEAALSYANIEAMRKDCHNLY